MFDGLRRRINSSQYLRTVKDALLRRTPAGHSLTVFPDDLFLVSYPRSGQTWTRFLLTNLKDPENPGTFANIAARVPGNHAYSDRVLSRFPRPRIISSHSPFDPYYPSVVYIVRDPRDVAVSRYYFELKLGAFDDGYPMDDFVRSFVAGEVDEYRKTAAWGDHVLSWLAMRTGQPNFLLMRYEDLKRDTLGQLARLASFLKLEADPKRLARAIELSSAQRMRELDEKQPVGWMRGMRRDVPFIRKGIAGGWRSQLSNAAVTTIESAWGPLMKLLGYPMESRVTADEASARVSRSTCAILRSLPIFEQALSNDIT
jgi:Sulfotransferase domain